MNYEFGKTYEMKVCRIDRDSAGYDYMALEDNEGKEQRVYNILKSQFNELPYRIAVKLTYDYGDGRYRFRQDETIVLRAHYEIGKPYAFRIAAIEKDSNNSSYYNIEDDFAVQRYYFKGEPKYHIGDGCILELSYY